jgi:gentisate 1,2-dioxygenase
MNDTHGAFFNYQDFRENLKQSLPQPRIWNTAALDRIRGEFIGTEVDTVALATGDSIHCCEVVAGMAMAMQWLEPGHTMQGHRHSWWHLFIIQKGLGELVIGNRDPLPISAGDVLLIPAWTDHGFANTSSTEPLSMLNLSNMPQVSALANFLPSVPSTREQPDCPSVA